MDLTKGISLLFLCGLVLVIEARPNKKKVQHWWEEDWEPYFGKAGTVHESNKNLVADKLQHEDVKAKEAEQDTKESLKAQEPLVKLKEPVKPKGPVNLSQNSLYNPTEEGDWGKKHDKEDYNRFVEDEDYKKYYDDIEDEEDDDEYDYEDEEDLEEGGENQDVKSVEGKRQSKESQSKESEEKVEKESEAEHNAEDEQVQVEEKDYKEIDEMKKKEETVADKVVQDILKATEEGRKEEKEDESKEVEKEIPMTTQAPLVADGSEKTQSVKKDLMDSAYLKEFAKTRADLKTSPNPPPPGLVDGKITMVTPSGKKPLLKENEPVYIQSKPFATCKTNADCRVGRMCHKEVCVCLGIDQCQGHYKPVCGMDRWSSTWFPSHCELHRTACIRGEHIKIDHSRSCLKKKEQVDFDLKPAKEEHVQPLIDKTEIDIDNEIPQEAIKMPLLNSGEIYDYPRGRPSSKSKQTKSEKPQIKKVAIKMKECTRDEYEKFKQQLLEFHCRKFNEKNCLTDLKGEREYLATLMFSFYDRDLDFYLEEKEAQEMEAKEHFESLSDACVLSDLIVYADNNPVDGRLSVTEFIAAFNGSEKVQKPPAHQTVEVIPTLATVGNGLELKCGLVDAEKIVWRRYNNDIHELKIDELTVFEDGSLFFSKVGVHHMGNYSCEDRNNPTTIQVHALRVQMAPIVHVTPQSVNTVSGSNIELHCHAEGLPKPNIEWKMNDAPIPNAPNHYLRSHENGTLSVYESDYIRDSGEYTCIASNSAGKSQDVAVVDIRPRKHFGGGYHQVTGSFLVFHKKGYTVYEAGTCLFEREVRPEFGNFKFIPDNLDAPLSLCQGEACEWGRAVEVKKFVYVSQPSLNRVIIVDTAVSWNPIQVIDTDKVPMELHYLEHLDQVWVLCWNSLKDSSVKTVVVIRDASQYIQHHAVHLQPVGNKLDTVRDLFLPPNNDLHHAFKYGYVSHNQQQGLSKINLKTMKDEKTIDFTEYNCVPKSLAYVPIGGHVMIECISEETGETTQLIMDYITDKVVSMNRVTGTPYVSPDSRHVVTVNKMYGKISVLRVSTTGLLENEFELTLSSSIDDVAFFPSPIHSGYEVVFTSADDDDIFFLNLANGKLDKVKGSTLADAEWKPQPEKKTLVTGGVFSEYLLSSLPNSVRIINGKNHHIRCTYDSPVSSQAIAFVLK